MTEKQFPLISDDEIMLGEMPYMNLYDELDFISNILGDYQDKDYLGISKDQQGQEEAVPAVTGRRKRHAAAVGSLKLVSSSEAQVKSYAELAREEAKADLKKKRSAPYLTAAASNPKLGTVASKFGKVNRNEDSAKAVPTAFFQKEQAGEFAKYSQKLSQEDYILADIPPHYQPKQTPIQADSKEKKNNYDFLKSSQIYNNKKEIQSRHERAVAQELNLTRLDEK